MKIKGFLWILTLSLLIQPLYAQQFKYGIANGLNLSSFRGSYQYSEEDINLKFDSKLTFRYSVGALARFEFTDNFGIQTEVLYSAKGTGFKDDIEINEQTVTIDGGVIINYIEIPLFLRFSTRLPSRGPLFYRVPGFTYNFYIGGYYGLNTRSKFSGTVSGTIVGPSLNDEFENDIKDSLQKDDYGLVTGIGFEHGLTTKFLFDIRYIYGLNDIGNDPMTNLSIHNSVIAISIGVVF
jgi:hypothetical protein